MRRALIAGLSLALLGALPAYGQERVIEKETRTQVRKVSTLMGARVTIERGDSFGKVTDIVLNEDGCVEYLIVGYEDQLVPVPWGAVTYNVDERTVAVNVRVTKDKLRDLAFRSERWPNFREERFLRNARSVWGEKAFRQEHRGGGRPGVDRREDRRDDRRDDRTPPPRPDRPPQKDKPPPPKDKPRTPPPG
jgi:sporulation protein YlmC with PRC-barrel domain